MTYPEAVRALRANPAYDSLVRDAYITTDALGDAERFAQSDEFAELSDLIGPRLRGGTIVDIGAGRGIASFAFAKAGATKVIAVEPDPDFDVGNGAIASLARGLPIEVVPSFGEAIPLGDAVADVVYMRQVLHHAHDLNMLVAECARLLKPGGMFIASREHVVDNAEQLEEFLAAHPIHQLSGTEAAYSLNRYLAAIDAAALSIREVFGPYDSVINAFPGVRTREEMRRLPGTALRNRFGRLGRLLGVVPGIAKRFGLDWLRQQAETVPGRLYTFVAVRE